ncbi:MAG: LamG domain-containing protein [Candidatus Micrarchaeota archaeon]|nr:LamG domain-containing protein [Candidatus Micrarchaeota archaeon]
MVSKRGVFLSLDAAVAIIMAFVAAFIAFSFYSSWQESEFKSQLLRSYLHDSATVLSKKGLFSPPSFSEFNLTGVREVLFSTSPAICIQVLGFGTLVTDGLVGYWRLDEDSGGSISDSSGNKLFGTLFGSPMFMQEGKAGRSILFKEGSWAVVPYSALFPQESFSLSFWVKGNNQGRVQLALQIPQSYEVGLEDDGTLFFSIFSATETTLYGPSILDGNWHHVVASYGPQGNATLYVDSALVASDSSSPPRKNQENLYIASNSGEIALDDIRLYNRALSKNEIAQLYSNPSNLVYVVDKPGCSYSGGEIQSITVPFSITQNQLQTEYFYATIRGWYRGGGPQ